MNERAMTRVAGCLAVLGLAGCGQNGFEELNAPNQQNVQLVRSEFSNEAETSGPAVNPLAGRTEAAWATLNVHATLEGSKPTPRQLSISRDNAICQPGGRPVYSNLLQLADDGSLGNVLLYLNTDLPVDDSAEENPIWVHFRYSIEKNQDLSTVEFDQKQCLFLSPVFAMRSNQTLLVLNSDPIGHNTKLNTTKAKSFNSTIEANDSATYEPGAEERQPFKVECSIHPWMQAFMITRNNPYFGVSDATKKGEFTIADIPAGVELEYRIWIVDKFAEAGSATLTLDGQPVEIKRGGKINLTLKPGETHDLKLVVSSSAFGA